MPESTHPDTDLGAELSARVSAAARDHTPLVIKGSGSKSFLGTITEGETLDVSAHRGILNYEPKELVITARAGTTLEVIESQLAKNGQMLGFEPPRFGENATLGGTVAAGLSGPRRVAAGSCRDFVLGARIIDGRGRILRFGGEVIKNVAGYDLSRLMTGAFGTLGVLLDVSLRVVPRPRSEMTLRFECSQAQAIDKLAAWAGKPWPISASAWFDGQLMLRLSGPPSALTSAVAQIGGQRSDGADAFWTDLREHRHAFFTRSSTLWRISLSPASPPLALPGTSLLEWHGAQRWLSSDASSATIREQVAAVGGHATCFRGDAPSFHPLPTALLALQQRLKSTLDPHGILNPGRMYPEL